MSFTKNQPSRMLLVFSFALLICSGGLACGGGGGGGDDRRTRDTAVRIIHGSLDGAPVSLRLSEDVLLKTRFAESSGYTRVNSGSVVFNVERANSPGVGVDTVSAELEDETEYTLFINGQAVTGAINARLIVEPVEEPEEGTARVQFLHGLEVGGLLTFEGAEFTTDPVALGRSSGFVTTTSGPQTFRVKFRDGSTIGRIDLDIEERSEVTVLVAGNLELDFVSLQSFVDFD